MHEGDPIGKMDPLKTSAHVRWRKKDPINMKWKCRVRSFNTSALVFPCVSERWNDATNQSSVMMNGKSSSEGEPDLSSDKIKTLAKARGSTKLGEMEDLVQCDAPTLSFGAYAYCSLNNTASSH